MKYWTHPTKKTKLNSVDQAQNYDELESLFLSVDEYGRGGASKGPNKIITPSGQGQFPQQQFAGQYQGYLDQSQSMNPAHLHLQSSATSSQIPLEMQQQLLQAQMQQRQQGMTQPQIMQQQMQYQQQLQSQMQPMYQPQSPTPHPNLQGHQQSQILQQQQNLPGQPSNSHPGPVHQTKESQQKEGAQQKSYQFHHHQPNQFGGGIETFSPSDQHGQIHHLQMQQQPHHQQSHPHAHQQHPQHQQHQHQQHHQHNQQHPRTLR
eukprot:TRINITY_DN3482_c0_g5_i1.p1 TRINITY_DN3482_c0_g5~~TRINITY_DN3482_c0_g5_i1.p1  ORF type:complete len:262 (-),score=60.59 TRINITY_DN3482_c0_g5_i1:75-860(-)